MTDCRDTTAVLRTLSPTPRTLQEVCIGIEVVDPDEVVGDVVLGDQEPGEQRQQR